jgi:hypothetical protein
MVPELDTDPELLPLCDTLPVLQPEEDSETLEDTDADPEWL